MENTKLVDSTENLFCPDGKSHNWIDITSKNGMWKILKCSRCQAIDPCGISGKILELIDF